MLKKERNNRGEGEKVMTNPKKTEMPNSKPPAAPPLSPFPKGASGGNPKRVRHGNPPKYADRTKRP